uniref:Uncharacterized protein n=1 Tax=Oryza punctata TaxID=4537 RepID=A0A0E0JCZ5_ORYPU
MTSLWGGRGGQGGRGSRAPSACWTAVRETFRAKIVDTVAQAYELVQVLGGDLDGMKHNVDRLCLVKSVHGFVYRLPQTGHQELDGAAGRCCCCCLPLVSRERVLLLPLPGKEHEDAGLAAAVQPALNATVAADHRRPWTGTKGRGCAPATTSCAASTADATDEVTRRKPMGPSGVELDGCVLGLASSTFSALLSYQTPATMFTIRMRKMTRGSTMTIAHDLTVLRAIIECKHERHNGQDEEDAHERVVELLEHQLPHRRCRRGGGARRWRPWRRRCTRCCECTADGGHRRRRWCWVAGCDCEDGDGSGLAEVVRKNLGRPGKIPRAMRTSTDPPRLLQLELGVGVGEEVSKP